MIEEVLTEVFSDKANPLPDDFSESAYFFIRREFVVTLPATLKEDAVLPLIPVIRKNISEEFKREGFTNHRIERITADDEIYIKRDVLSINITATGYKKIKEAK